MRAGLRMNLLLAVLAGILPSAAALAASEWILDLSPGVLLVHSKSGGFTLEKAGASDEATSMVSTYPNAAFGLSTAFTEGYWDFKVGAGMIVNGRFNSYTLFAMTDLSFEISPGILFGPHIGYGYFGAPSWWGDGEVDFSDSMGSLWGVHFLTGDKILYHFSLDYYSLAFDVDSTSDGWTADDDKLDLSGLGVMFGFRVRF